MEKMISLLDHTGVSVKMLNQHDIDNGTQFLEEFLSKLVNPTLETIESKIDDDLGRLGLNPEKLIPIKISDLYTCKNDTVIAYYYIVDEGEDLYELANNISPELRAIHKSGCYVDDNIIFISHTRKDTRIHTDINGLSEKWDEVYQVYGEWLDFEKLRQLPADVVRNTVIATYEMYTEYHETYGDQIPIVTVFDDHFTIMTNDDRRTVKLTSVCFIRPRLIRLSYPNRHYSNYRIGVIEIKFNTKGDLVFKYGEKTDQSVGDRS